MLHTRARREAGRRSTRTAAAAVIEPADPRRAARPPEIDSGTRHDDWVPRSDSALVGRDGELAALLAAAPALATTSTRTTSAPRPIPTPSASVVILDGDAGIGKTRLLARTEPPGPGRRRPHAGRPLRRPGRLAAALPARSARPSAASRSTSPPWPPTCSRSTRRWRASSRASFSASPPTRRPRRRRAARPRRAVRRRHRRTGHPGRRAAAAVHHRGRALGRPGHPRPARLPVHPAGRRASGSQ